MHDHATASASLELGTRPAVPAAVVPVVAIAIIGVVIIRPSAGGVLG